MIDTNGRNEEFSSALALVLKQEGGKVDDPVDPGGRTNQGITQAVFDAWRVKQGLSRRDVYLILPSEVTVIYRDQYATAIQFDELPAGVSYATLDAAVNSGPVRAAQWLQRALGVGTDGHIGVLTIAAARKTNPVALIDAMCDARLGFLRCLPTWLHFELGWTRRVAFVRLNAGLLADRAKATA